ncbi:hypothetical protein Ddc_17833 [Ditylenchus destructor]|nr:hypothetical protein Ddc_17833 [Ditylenchus destructor]
MELRTMQKPLNVMFDPRVYRGSVTAHKREEAKRYKEHLKAEQADEKYRTELIRNRLSMFVGDSKSQISMPPYTEIEHKINTGKVNGTGKIARLAGPLRFRHGKPQRFGKIDWKGAPSLGAQKEMLEKFQAIPQKVKGDFRRPLDQRPFPKLPVINAAGESLMGKSKPGRDVARPGFNVRFEPTRSFDYGAQDQLPKVVPMPYGILPSERRPFPPARQRYRQIREVPSPWEQNPPPTAAGRPVLNDATVQTDEIFEETFAPLVTEMVSGAIADAKRSLIEADEKRLVQKKNRELEAVIQDHIGKNMELSQSIAYQLETQKNWRQSPRLEFGARWDVVGGMVDDSLTLLINQGRVIEEVTQRCAAVDTRHLVKEQAKRNRTIEEVKNDFFPYVYKKAERIFVHKMADSFLQDALFSTDEVIRQKARNQLNTELEKYSMLNP